MPFLKMNDTTNLYYRDWGNKDAPVVVFVSAWALHSAMWEYQMFPLSEQGLRCIAFDRRGHGRSEESMSDYAIDTLADDLAQVLTQLDLPNVTLIGNSMGCGEIARYLTRHGDSRTARVVFTSPSTPCALQREDYPQGAPRAALDAHIAALCKDRPLYMANGAPKYFALGSNWPGPEMLSPQLTQWITRVIQEISLYATIEAMRANWESDFRPDLRAMQVPTLIIHGDRDQNAPLDRCGRPTANLIAGSVLKVYEGAPHGMFLTHRDRLTSDLLAFIKGDAQ
ncbi:MAG TPA: alpha/beta hydrolase [Ktedonobacteraceae bacterium]|nr:alpha/beta hydrolase [Ktedonobacteraceae bacterium]